MAKQNGKQRPKLGVANGRVQNFSLAALQAKNVQLVGDFTQWEQKPIPMQKGQDGIWTTSVELKPGAHSYRFLVDGQWHDDPQCARRVPNPYGGENAVCEIG
jgi:1,4-alpha-glucan branching enzyme